MLFFLALRHSSPTLRDKNSSDLDIFALEEKHSPDEVLFRRRGIFFATIAPVNEGVSESGGARWFETFLVSSPLDDLCIDVWISVMII